MPIPPRPSLLLPLLLASLFAPAALAQADLLRCAALQDPATRLQCYDALAAGLRAAQTSEPPAAPAVEAAAPAAAAATMLPRGGEDTAQALFGFESRPEEQREITEVVDVLEATVARASHSPFSGWTLTLDNGQVWKQIGSDRFNIEVGDTAVITRGSLNSFLLQRNGAGRRVRVSRVE